MKKIIFIPVMLFITFLLFSGCYTYLSLSNGAKLAKVPYEPYFPPPPSLYPQYPPYGPIVVIINPAPDPYQRPKEISDIRNGGDGRISDDNRRR